MNRTHHYVSTRPDRGVSLVEVLTVVAVTALLLAIAMPLYLTSQRHGRRRSCEAQMSALIQAEQAYKTRNRVYTTTLSTLGEQLAGMPQCPSGNAAYTATITGAGATEQVTIRCNNTGAHITGQKLQTSDGVVFVGVAP
jgi:prepilin-type N-terminal cleavage/methylation domain-containing protein